MIEEFEVSESSGVGFDIKKFLFRALSYWKLFVLLFAVGVFFVYQKNIREEFSYRLGTKISIEDDSNPLFTSNTSLTFNWGGVTSKVQTMIVTLKSRTHHEKVVDRLEFYKSYLKQGRFTKQDIYKAAPFRFDHDKNYGQLIGLPVQITFLDNDTFELEVNFTNPTVSVQNFTTKEISHIDVPVGVFKRRFKLNAPIDLPFFKGVIRLAENRKVVSGAKFFVRFSNFDSVVASYAARTNISSTKNSPILDVFLIDKNTQKLVDYLNTVVDVLSEDQLNLKNQYATNAIKFIDEQLERAKIEMRDNANELNNYRRKHKIYNLDTDGSQLNAKLMGIEAAKESINKELNYYAILKDYLLTSNTFTDIPAPASTGITDANIQSNLSRITELSVEKSKLQYAVRKDASVFNDLNREIEGLKQVLIENISAVTNILRKDLDEVYSKMNKIEEEFNTLPEDQQILLGIKRQYALSEKTYNVFLAKRGEAEIIKASNVSDILVVDPAKNTGATVLGQNLNIRYVFAFFVALLIPMLIAFVITFLDKNIHSPIDLERLSSVPLLGVVGKSYLGDNLVVHRKPKSSVSESFRAIRSNLQYYYKAKDLQGAKTLLLTSSVSGEGKTFCSINIATVFALSGKKTVLVGLDLRKPKIFSDFKIKNDIGVVNYLIGQENLDGIIQNTEIENLDLIVSGPVPPNPSELLISENMIELIRELKKRYEYIILDTPPLGLVADALEILDFVDASIYVVRQDYTKRDMLNFVNEKYKTKQIKNLSLVYNGFDQKSKYGYGYGYSYGYGYGDYANGYHEDEKAKTIVARIKSIFKKV